MDQVNLTRGQLRVMTEKQIDFTITATNEDAGLIFVEPTKYIGAEKGKWLQKDGRTREGKKF